MNGYAATSTRAIADRVGIRQASLYYHFAGKDEILLELLNTSVQPSLAFAEGAMARVSVGECTAAAALEEIIAFDIRTLLGSPHNVGLLYLLPELQDPQLDAFQRTRDDLQRIYGRLGRVAVSPGLFIDDSEDFLGTLIMQIVESTVMYRRNGYVPATLGDDLTAGCLRVLGLSSSRCSRQSVERA